MSQKATMSLVGKIPSALILILGVTAVYKPEYAFCNSTYLAVFAQLSFFTLSYLVYRLVLYPEYLTPIKHIQTPAKRHWLTGNADSIFSEDLYFKIRQWIRLMPNESLIRFYVFGNIEGVMVTSPNALRDVLVTRAYDFVKPNTVQQKLLPILGKGMLLAEGDEHKAQRKTFLPAFSFRHVKDMYPIFWAKSVEMIKSIQSDLDRQDRNGDNTVQVRNWATRATLDIIGVAGMGYDFNSLNDPFHRLQCSYGKIYTSPSLLNKLISLLGACLGDISLFQKLPTKHNRDIRAAETVFHDTARQIIQQRQVRMSDTSISDVVDLVSLAIQNSSTFDEEDAIEQLMTFLAVGHETTSSAFQWAVYALSKAPDVQLKLREEIRTYLPSPSDKDPLLMTASTIDKLPYLHAVCNEVLRLYPSIPLTVRIAHKDTFIAGEFIPKGTALIVAPGIINRLEKHWGSDADNFNPDRFMDPTSMEQVSNYAFLTFLHGPRSCIGQKFAKSELACLLAATVGRFHIELKYPDRNLEIREEITVSPKDGVLAKFIPLEGW